VATGLPRLRLTLDGLRDTGLLPRYLASLGVFAEAVGRAGHVAEGLAAIDEALARSECTEACWCVAELLRFKGELLLLDGAPDSVGSASDHFFRALDCARRQGAISWELRTAMSLARLQHDQGRTKAAQALLAPIYNRFTEGFGTADLVAAKSLLDVLGPSSPERERGSDPQKWAGEGI
jgi:predicted ATPase